MFDFAWSEIALIAVVALVVIGPKDLPRVLRTVGVWTSRARNIARDFQSSLDQMIRESELDDIKKQVEQAANIDLKGEIEKSIDPGRDIEKQLSEPIMMDAETAPPRPETAPPVLPDLTAENEAVQKENTNADRPSMEPPPSTGTHN